MAAGGSDSRNASCNFTVLEINFSACSMLIFFYVLPPPVTDTTPLPMLPVQLFPNLNDLSFASLEIEDEIQPKLTTSSSVLIHHPNPDGNLSSPLSPL